MCILSLLVYFILFTFLVKGRFAGTKVDLAPENRKGAV
jgi:hypothetical protein